MPEFVRCPRCGGETFKITRERQSSRMFARDKLTVTCLGCLYSESLFRIGENREEVERA